MPDLIFQDRRLSKRPKSINLVYIKIIPQLWRKKCRAVAFVLPLPLLAVPNEYKDNNGSSISCFYNIAGRSGGGQPKAVSERDVSRVRHSHLARKEMLNLH
jgi:hypothetical protein